MRWCYLVGAGDSREIDFYIILTRDLRGFYDVIHHDIIIKDDNYFKYYILYSILLLETTKAIKESFQFSWHI
jgi:hypothetical protein